MTTASFLQLVVYVSVLLLAAVPLGLFIANVMNGERTFLSPLLASVERIVYRVGGIDPARESTWLEYALAAMLFNVGGLLIAYAIQRLQGWLPLNPQHLGAISPDSSLNTAVSFATNTDWQGYSGETTMSYATQMLALTVQNFVSAATGIAVLIAFVRGFVRKSAASIGNFWVDLTRSILYVLLPLAVVVALVLVSQGVVQTFAPYVTTDLVQPSGETVQQTIAVGPAASQVAIKQLGTNGGGFFNANSAHPFENPTPLSNFVELLSILLIPAALCVTFGKLVGDARQGAAVLAAMTIVFVALTLLCNFAEQSGNPLLDSLADTTPSATSAGGNMEGKEVRFGIGASALWAAATTAASNGSVNAMHDSFTPIGGLVPMWLMQLGEVIFGGVGSGLYGMLVFAIIAVFIAGLMIGRTPEYLGKKIEAFEMKMASIVILMPPAIVLIGTAVAVCVDAGAVGVANPGTHGFSEILYAFSSAGNNNGSAFAGLSVNTPFYNTALGIAMYLARYWLLIPTLAIAGSLAAKRAVAPGAGTLPTHTPLFVGLLIATVLLVGALTFVPALALGPIAEHLQMVQR
jgi:K+-transporting ATPase ATPase A chain